MVAKGKVLKRAALAAALCMTSTLQPVHAGALTGGATEWTQLANNGILVSNLAQIIIQTNQIIQNGKHLWSQLQDMRVQAQSLANLDWSNFLSYMDNLETILQQGKALSFTAISAERKFQSQFSGYVDYLESLTGYNPQYFEEKYSEWHDSLNDSLQSTLRLHNITYDKIRSEEDRLQLIESRARTAVGRNELLKVGSDLAYLTSEQMRSLLAIQMQHSQVHSQFMAHQSNQDQIQQARKQQFMMQGEKPVLGDGANW